MSNRDVGAVVDGAPSGLPDMLVMQIGSRVAAVPVRYVSETMRPLPIEAISRAPSFILGISVIRGVPTPVVDMRELLEVERDGASFGRFVAVAVEGRPFALAVDRVIGLRSLAGARLEDLPPVLGDDRGKGPIEVFGCQDDEFLLLLRVARLVPDEVWELLIQEMVPC